MANTYTETLNQLTALLEAADRVSGAAVIGSRGSGQADQAADLDVAVFADSAEGAGELLGAVRWLSPLGRIWASTLDRSEPQLPLRRLLLDDAVQLDLVILGPEALPALAGGARRILAEAARRGFAVVKAGGPVPGGLEELAAEEARPARPSQEEFAELVSRFWIDVARVARRLGRGEVWSALRLTNGPLKDAMVQMQAWITRAVKGADWDTYWDGRHLGTWAGQRFERELAGAWAAFDEDSVRRALIETMDQFRLQAIQAAQRWALDYPEALDRRATVWVRTWE
ncbi:MAG: aminoglycoside 6-adenylyltransferase [Bifidobacteriaceae bacterium]|nr:aminoglycoside 6-adenylyltransferase [Bifidobacteriaceae bacterium]